MYKQGGVYSRPPLGPRALVVAPLIWVGKILFLVGFVTNYWYKYMSVGAYRYPSHRGLWKICSTIDYTTNCAAFFPLEGWYTGVRALECIALIGISVASFQSLFYLIRRVKTRLIIGAVATVFGGFMGIIGCIIMAVKISNLGFTLGWSLYLDAVGCVLCVAGGPLLFLEYRSRDQ
ncbi:hypothetical protein SNE40_013527 [Patella caerulea]|uniref:Uncharacterized protein n=1 Tax=Patella caerulea TaxID=87958 RepID=A0AAN8JGB7_PATCE